MSQGVTVDFTANIARFTTALDKATNDLTKFQSHASRVSGDIGKAFAGLGVGLSVAGIVAFAKSAIDAADHMNDLAKTTGLTVEQISGLQLAAKQTGTDLDGVAKAVEKLSVNMGKDAKKFEEIGINAKDPIEALKQLADVFVGVTDPQQRAALGAAALGKSWAEVAPLLAEGGTAIGEMVDKGTALSGSIKAMAERSDAFNDKLAEMHTRTQGLVTDALTPLLPMMLELANYFSDTSGQARKASDDVGALGVIFQALAVTGANVAFVFKAVGSELGGIGAQIAALAHGDMQGFDAISKAMKADADEAKKVLDEFEQRLLNPQKPKENSAPSRVTTAPGNLRKFIGDTGAVAEAAENKKRLENNLKLLDDAAKEEEGILASRNKMLDFFYGENLLSIRDYYASKNAAQDEALSRTLADYDKEIAALNENNKLEITSDLERIANAGKINDINEKKRKLIVDSGEASVKFSLEESKAAKDLQKSLDGLNVQYMTMNNQLGEAAGLSFDLSNAQLKERLTTEGNIEALKELEKLRQRAVENASTSGEAGFNRAMRNYANIAADTGKQIESLMTNAFKGMEDALVKFVMTGKLDFKSLADSIIADLIRIQVQQQITGPLAAWLGSPSYSQTSGLSGMNPNQPIMSANGNVFGFASGGAFTNQLFNSPTPFRFATGSGFNLGIMGEAGPEAVMPLSRDSSGKLGVRAQGGGLHITNAPVIQIDSRTDRADVQRLVSNAVQQGNAQLVETLRRQGTI